MRRKLGSRGRWQGGAVRGRAITGVAFAQRRDGVGKRNGGGGQRSVPKAWLQGVFSLLGLVSFPILLELGRVLAIFGKFPDEGVSKMTGL